MSFLSRANTVVPLSQSYQKRATLRSRVFWRRSVRDIVRSNAFKLPSPRKKREKWRKMIGTLILVSLFSSFLYPLISCLLFSPQSGPSISVRKNLAM